MRAYFDCFSGISGDMTLGALIDLGTPVDWLQNELSRLPLTGFDLKLTPVVRSGICATGVSVESEDSGPSRDYKAIKSLLESCPLSDGVKAKSLAVFERLARAEAGIHGCSLHDVHFHEVGGVDAIVDIVGTALCLERLRISQVSSSRIPLGSGFVDCQHGKLPIPAPATIEILKDTPVYGTDVTSELVTPTGAAIIASLAESFGPLPPMHVKKTGYGAGHRELPDRPNLLRIMVGTSAEPTDGLQTDHIIILETCIDDMNPELFGFIMERLFSDGALDVYWLPLHMKKDRPGTLVQVICEEAAKDRLMQRLLSETTSLGVRYYKAARKRLVRELVTLHTSFGDIQVKQVKDPDGGERLVPEYEVCRKIALERNLPLRIVYDTIIQEAAAKKASD
ncbi:MAG: nickel pincer cofactor biosynthesis protein LarC [Deltaproteobacteria bacterium]|jgi:uncharacterized protein (TIGR00299 family) protein|nr:nickel pincer cofactor biosynthesis protein LarC [Deltaproteobacteria bacterium]